MANKNRNTGGNQTNKSFNFNFFSGNKVSCLDLLYLWLLVVLLQSSLGTMVLELDGMMVLR